MFELRFVSRESIQSKMIEQPTLAATFHLTHGCNLRCTYCYTGEKTGRSMTRKTADQAVDFTLVEARKSGARFLDVTFFGGEPLLEKELIFHIADRFLKEKSPETDLFLKTSTNGLLLSEPVLTELSKRRIYVSISSDGPPDIHDRLRPNAGGGPTSRAVERAMGLLLKSNPAANATCVIVPETATEAARSVEWLFEKGFRYINATLDYSAPWTMDDMAALEISYKKMATWYEKMLRSGHRFWLSAIDERIRSRTQRPPSEAERCSLGRRQFSIAPDGGLYPCTQFVRTEGLPEFLIGHVEHGGFDEACRSHLHGCSEAPKPECGGCALRGRCSSWCACINFASTGRIDRASPVVCHHEQRLLPIVDRLAGRLFEGRNALFLHKHYNPSYPVIEFLEAVA